MYYRLGTGVCCWLLHRCHADALCSLTRWRCQHFSASNGVGHGRHLECVTSNRNPSFDAYLGEEDSCQIASGSDLKQRIFRLFSEDNKTTPQEEEEEKMSSAEKKSVPDLKNPPLSVHCAVLMKMIPSYLLSQFLPSCLLGLANNLCAEDVDAVSGIR